MILKKAVSTRLCKDSSQAFTRQHSFHKTYLLLLFVFISVYVDGNTGIERLYNQICSDISERLNIQR